MTEKPDLIQVLPTLPGEVWRYAEESVWVSTHGRAWTTKSRRLLACTRNGAGYATVSMSSGNQYLHRLIAEAFLGPAPFKGAVVRHLDDDNSNNHLSNLARGSRADNSADALRNGRMRPRRGELAGGARLTEVQVREIRAWRSYGFTNRAVASWYCVSTEAVAAVNTRKNWSHVE